VKRGITGYTSNARTASLMALMFVSGACWESSVWGGPWWLSLVVLLLLLVTLAVTVGEPGPNDPLKTGGVVYCHHDGIVEMKDCPVHGPAWRERERAEERP
jgi:hypothetical protein